MIISSLIGGLGNQMFQYAAGLALAEHRRTVLKLDISWFRDRSDHATHNRYGLNCFNVLEQFATEAEVFHVRDYHLRRRERRLLHAAGRICDLFGFPNLSPRILPDGKVHVQEAFGFYPEFFDLPDNIYLYGAYQSERFFAPVAELVRLHFTFRYDPPERVAAMRDLIWTATAPVAVHLRYGDYKKASPNHQGHESPPIDYYLRAEEIIRERYPNATLFIFSDELDLARRDYRPRGNHIFVDVTTRWNPFDDLRLMAACEHAIIANSTFSWWCGWLITNPAKVVIAPTPWFTSHSHYEGDIIPDSWLKLPRQQTQSPAPAPAMQTAS